MIISYAEISLTQRRIRRCRDAFHIVPHYAGAIDHMSRLDVFALQIRPPNGTTADDELIWIGIVISRGSYSLQWRGDILVVAGVQNIGQTYLPAIAQAFNGFGLFLGSSQSR